MVKPHNKSVLVVAATISLLLVLRLSSLFFSRSTGSVDPRINLHENQASQILERQRQQQVAAFLAVTEGEVSRTEERIRETTALAAAAAIYATSESLNRRAPASVSALLSGLNSAGLMPPEMEVLDSKGEVITRHSTLVMRYKFDPLGIEVVSIGKVSLDGPALLVRVGGNDTSGTDKNGTDLYVATTLEHVTIPAPFATEAEIIALGFAPEPFRAAKLTLK